MNYGDKHTEDSLSSRLGRLYGIERGLDCGPNIIMDQYWKVWDGGERQDRYKWYYEADFLYITKSYYLYEVEVKISIADFRAEQKKNKYHDHPSEHTVWINMDNDDFSTVFLSCDTLEGAKRAMDELATAINKAN
ncbi:hypothetical protein [Phascolarctobacterium succinatutens]|uniref:hypothetical protein n=1 Tax=Phascolarctobacterium succinatutens TaxID=626940 RepID=UPI0026EF82A0|nr:hypothetical protein [Phascolarctobacterium succinatutens]